VATALAAEEVMVNLIEGLRRRASAARSVWRRHEPEGDGVKGRR
jgi:hypothetical protein